MKIAITAIAAIAGAATASPYFTAANGNQGVGSSAPAGAIVTVTLDLSGVNNWDPQFDADNEFLSNNLGANAHIIGISWDVNLATVGASWLSEAVMAFNSDLFLTVGIGDDTAGTASYSSGGMLDLVGTGLDFFLDASGLLNIEFFESFDDVADAIDSTYGAGSSIQVQYIIPAPGALAMLGLGGIVAGRRRR
ncbi:MAG: PEP-CTERM sorting domain-containing protein [Phycisphaerales bacterium]|nr:PEP-CTERM sorting domain-containing protein [Phycisphaerales bacterium]